MPSVTLIWNKQGRVALQLCGDRIYDQAGHCVGWVRGESIYDRAGQHAGWFIGGILRDMYGRVLGFTNKIAPGQPHPELPQELEGAPPSSLEGRHSKPGFTGAPGKPLLGGKPPLGAAWSQHDPHEYFERR